MYNGKPKIRPARTPRGHGTVNPRVGKGSNNRATRMSLAACGGNVKKRAGAYGRHIIGSLKVPIIHPMFGEVYRQFEFHARKGMRSYLITEPWSEADRNAGHAFTKA